MSTTTLRWLRIFLPIAALAVVTALLFPVMNAGVSDGPHDGQTWAWNALGWPLLPGVAGLGLWLVVALLLSGTTWLYLSTRIARAGGPATS